MQYLPRVWFRLKFIKYKYLGRGEPELRLIRYFVEPGTTAVDVGASIGMYSAEMARHAARVVAFEANPEVARFTRTVAARNVEVVRGRALIAGGAHHPVDAEKPQGACGYRTRDDRPQPPRERRAQSTLSGRNTATRRHFPISELQLRQDRRGRPRRSRPRRRPVA
jgi:hypothetical protein